MSTADRPAGAAAAASDVAAACHEAGFVRLVATADGDALAATGVLARALDAARRPFQASVVEPPADPERRTEADLVVSLGRTDPTADCSLAPGNVPVSELAVAAARELGADPDPVLALAGARTADVTPSGDLLAAATDAGAQRRPGVAVPTPDVADGLAHSTLVHAPFSGDPEAAKAALAELGLLTEAVGETDDLEATDHRRIASMVAVRTVGAPEASTRSADAVERALHPHAVDNPFATVEGYGDVLDAVAREQPGTGVALALGHDAVEAATDAWRTHAERAHRALRSAKTGRYDGLFVARCDPDDLRVDDAADVPVGTAARLLRDFRSPEPTALFVTDGRAAVATSADDPDVSAAIGAAADGVEGTAAGTARRGQASFACEPEAFVRAFREAAT
ncbi:MAG: hypothetical protein ABEJ31_00455 [Haloarculaceae archaeon]